MKLLGGKVAVVTGAGSGVGRAGARLMARDGARIVVADVDAGAGEAVAREICDAGGEAIAIHVDVRDGASVQALVAGAVLIRGEQLTWTRALGTVAIVLGVVQLSRRSGVTASAVPNGAPPSPRDAGRRAARWPNACGRFMTAWRT